jgi:hypothetical protein
MAVAVARRPAEFESRLRQYVLERSEESRAVRVGEKEISEQAQIVARYADLFTREQLDALREDESRLAGDESERLYRLRKTCEGGMVAAELAQESDELENALLAARVDFRGEALPLRTAQARLAVLAEYRDREELGELQADVAATFNDRRLDLVRAGEQLEADVSGDADPVHRSEDEKDISLRELAGVLERASGEIDDAYAALRERWFERLLGPEREPVPSSFHMAFVRRLSPLESTYTKDRAVATCLETLRAQGGLHDYQAFLHEAGHALHYAGVDPSLPYAFRKLARDHALTEIYSYILEAISKEPAWHERYFDLSEEEAAENAEATVFLDAVLFRRYTAKLQFELDFWSRFADDGGTPAGYSERLTNGAGVFYREDNYLADMDAGFYSADYLRAWIRCAQLRKYLIGVAGEEWWRSREAGEFLRELFREGTKPSSEEIASRIGFEPLDTAPLVEELSAAR